MSLRWIDIFLLTNRTFIFFCSQAFEYFLSDAKPDLRLIDIVIYLLTIRTYNQAFYSKSLI